MIALRFVPQLTVVRPHEDTLFRPAVPGASAQKFGFAPHSQLPPMEQQPPPVEQEVSGPSPNVVHLQPPPPLVVAQATALQSHLVPASGQSRSAQQSAFETVVGVQPTALAGAVREGISHAQDLPVEYLSHDVDDAVFATGVPGTPGVTGVGSVETFPQSLSHCCSTQLASASLAGEGAEGETMREHAAPPFVAQASRSPTSPRQSPSAQHWLMSAPHARTRQLPHVAVSPLK